MGSYVGHLHNGPSKASRMLKGSSSEKTRDGQLFSKDTGASQGYTYARSVGHRADLSYQRLGGRPAGEVVLAKWSGAYPLAVIITSKARRTGGSSELGMEDDIAQQELLQAGRRRCWPTFREVLNLARHHIRIFVPHSYRFS